MIFSLSKGATTVRDIAPAIPPAAKTRIALSRPGLTLI